MFLSVSGFFVRDADMALSAQICSVFIIIVFVGRLFTFAYGVFAHFNLRSKKKLFHFFICHHKGGASAFAGLLKMHLNDELGISKRVFTDYDDLTNLSHLFD